MKVSGKNPSIYMEAQEAALVENSSVVLFQKETSESNAAGARPSCTGLSSGFNYPND